MQKLSVESEWNPWHTDNVEAKTCLGRRLPKSQVIIKRPAANHKVHYPRNYVSEELESGATLRAPEPSYPDGTSPMEISSSPSQAGPSEEPQHELSRMRATLKPPLIAGVVDWGIPPECSDTCEPALLVRSLLEFGTVFLLISDFQAKLSQFSALKMDPVNPRHFNDSLMSNRSFRNPHLYTKLVEFVDVNERSTNFPKTIWDPNDVKADWFADQIGMFPLPLE